MIMEIPVIAYRCGDFFFFFFYFFFFV